MENGTAPAIVLDHLTKAYGRLVAVRDLSLEVASGEVFGFLGLNGAGKTTTIRVLLDLLRPTSGRARVLGRDCQREGLAVRAQVGYLPGEIVLYNDMTGGQVLGLLGRLGAEPVRREYVRALYDRFELTATDLGRRLREYSTGMKRKIGLVQAFQHDPPLLILDEPTEGLDPLMQEAFYELLGEVRSRGRTVFMSSHVLSEVERVCSRIALLRKGRLALVSGVEDLRRLAARRVRAVFSSQARVPDRMSLPPGVELTTVTPLAWTFAARGPLGPLVQMLSGLPLADLKVEEPRLEDIVIDYYREAT
jgi:ABC-2 type transport system ATP-binding protein